MTDSAAATNGLLIDPDAYNERSESFDASFDNFRIRKHNRGNAPEAVITTRTPPSTARMVQDVVRETEKYRTKRIAHIVTRRLSTTQDRIKALIMLLDSYESLDPDTAVKIINVANKLISENAVPDADKVKIASALRKLVLKPIKKQGPTTYEEIALKRDGQFIIEVDDED